MNTVLLINTQGSTFENIYFYVHFLIDLSFPRQSWDLMCAERKFCSGMPLILLNLLSVSEIVEKVLR